MSIDPKVVELGRTAMDPSRRMEGLQLVGTHKKLADLCGVAISLVDASRGLKSKGLTDRNGYEAALASLLLFVHDWMLQEGIEL